MTMGGWWHTRLVPFLLLLPTASPTAAVSERCSQLGTQDALLILDVQNAFMEERSTRSGVSAVYDLSVDAPNGTIPRGALSVSNSSGIIDVINAWLALRERDNKNASVIATLDYHPPGHCSFCDVAHGGIEPLTSEGILQFCLQGRQTWSTDDTAGAVHLNDSHRCRDSVSQAAWDASMYYQWPYHAVAGTFDARFDPYLNLPNDTVVFKLGTRVMEDNYNAFDGGRRSTAAAGAHDTQSTATAMLDDSVHTLEAELAARGVKRLFVFGLATDYVVGETIYNALGLNSFREPIQQLVGGSVVVVDAAMRAIVSSGVVHNRVKERDQTLHPELQGVYPDGFVVTSTAPADALGEYCSRGLGTCDSVDQCEQSYTTHSRREYFCMPLLDLPWGECAACPIAEESTSICSGRGDCYTHCEARDPEMHASGLCTELIGATSHTHNVSGVCVCDILYWGDACEHNFVIPFVVMAVLVITMCCCGCLCGACLLYRRYNTPGLHLEATGMPPVITLEDGDEYHLFLSHIWATGQDQVALIKRSLTSLLPGAQIFLDVDDLKDMDHLERYVEKSAVILVFLSAGYFVSKNCLREIRAAVAYSKPIILVHETDPAKGGAPLDELKEMCPADIRHAIFNDNKPRSRTGQVPSNDMPHSVRHVVPWHRVVAFQLESLRQIAEEMLLHTPKYKHYLTKGKALEMYMPQRVGHRFMVTDFDYFMASPHVLITSDNNPGAEEAAAQLVASVQDVSHLHLGSMGAEPFADALLSVVTSAKATATRPKSMVSRSWWRFASKPIVGIPNVAAEVSKSRAMRGHGPVHPTPKDMKKMASHVQSPQRGHGDSTASVRGGGATHCHMLVYLSAETFGNEAHSDALAADIRNAMASGVPMLVIHEREPERGAMAFDHFNMITPEDLVRRGLYRKLATPWFDGRHAQVSRAVAAMAMGASRRRRAESHRRKNNVSMTSSHRSSGQARSKQMSVAVQAREAG